MLQLFLVLGALQHTQSPIDEFRAIGAFQCHMIAGSGHDYAPALPEQNEERVLTSPPLLEDDLADLIFDSIDYRAMRARSVMKNSGEAVTVTVIPGNRLLCRTQSQRDPDHFEHPAHSTSRKSALCGILFLRSFVPAPAF